MEEGKYYMFTYEELLEEIKMYLPEKYARGEAVRTEYINGLNLREINMDPYRELLPTYFLWKSKNEKIIYKMSAGEDYTAKLLLCMARNNEAHLIADLVIATTVNELLPKRRRRAHRSIPMVPYAEFFQELLVKAKDSIRSNGYGCWHQNSKKYLPLYGQGRYELAECASVALSSKEAFAKFLVELFDKAFSEYDIIYYRHTDTDYECANLYIETVQKKAVEKLLLEASAYGKTRKLVYDACDVKTE